MTIMKSTLSQYEQNEDNGFFHIFYFWDAATGFFCSWTFWILVLLPVIGPVLQILQYTIVILGASFYAWFFKKEDSYRKAEVDDDAFIGTQKLIALFFYLTGKLWYGYEIVGMEKFVENRENGALLVFSHGPIPLDVGFFISEFILKWDKKIKTYVAHFMFNIAGWSTGMKVAHMFTGTAEHVVQTLQNGYSVVLLPGGVFEAMAGDERYELCWKNRTGFARIALEAKVPIIPVFTENLREAFRVPKLGKSWLLNMYEKTKRAVSLIYGGFPVKLRTIVGDPIPYDSSLTPEQLAVKAADGLRRLIREHQRIPGSIPMAVLDRIVNKSTTKHQKSGD